MTYLTMRWYRSRKYQMVAFVFCIICIIYYLSTQNEIEELDVDITRRYIENKLQEALKEDKGTGCNIPRLDPFAPEIVKLERNLPKIECPGRDWVKCHLTKCRVVPEVFQTTNNIKCIYKDIIYINDQVGPRLGSPTVVYGSNAYTLNASDHVKVTCTGTHNDNILPSKWTGHTLGFRPIKLKTEPKSPFHSENTLNVLILGFDSTSRHGFIRKMPKSYKYLTEEMKVTILEGYNILGDGTPAALFPILTGKIELEYPDVRKAKSKETLDFMPFIFYKLKEHGYHTAYFEDMPWIGTFQYRFNGFSKQPADHYLRAFFIEESSNGQSWWGSSTKNKYCVGATPRYKIMLNITDQFLELTDKKYCFTFIADITHDDFNQIATADDDTEAFLKRFYQNGRMQDTLLILMGDHGSRFSKGRDTLQGKLEERLPMLAISLPHSLKRQRPGVQTALEANSQVLTTPHDIYATVLDVMGLRRYWNTYKIPGADLTRGLTLLEHIPSNRSCSEAGIEPHWCACLSWKNVSVTDPLYQKSAVALVDYINSLTDSVRDECTPRTLTTIEWVMKQEHNNGLLKFSNARDQDGYVGNFHSKVKVLKENYQVKMVVGPGKGIYEASMTYFMKKKEFVINTRDISRTNAYGDEPKCIGETHPHLNMYCYCTVQ